MSELRWRLADDDGDQLPLFGVNELTASERGSGRMSGLEFLHVTAKRILNPVPASSRMPFRWTINVYRGCSHACVYCLAGHTPILMADGRTKPLADVQVGERVYGTKPRGSRRHYVLTDVLAHWQTSKPAYRVTLKDEATIIASGDHCLLTSHGWVRVAATDNRQLGCLQADDELIGVGHLADPPYDGPATTHKRAIDNMAIKSDARLRVVSVEPLGLEIPMYDMTTGTGDFIADGVVSHNCFARPTHEYLGLNLGEDFDRKIVVKINAVEKVRAELATPTWSGEPIAMGTNTDPYQRCEAKYRLTRGVLEALTERANPFSILTKSPLVTRDVDILAKAARRADVQVNLSIGTLDERVWRATEPGTPHPRRRVDAMRRLAEAGIRTGALIAPVLPGVSDYPDQLTEVAAEITRAGGRVLGVLPLHLRPGTREHFLGWLAGHDRALHADYLRRYATSDYAPRRYAQRLQAIVTAAQPRENPSDWPTGWLA